MMYPALPQSFFVGECFDAYRTLGAHPATGADGQRGYHFAVWAPQVKSVAVIGEFNG